jgi:hypothetical protein
MADRVARLVAAHHVRFVFSAEPVERLARLARLRETSLA